MTTQKEARALFAVHAIRVELVQLLTVAAVSVKPDAGGLPGNASLQKLLNGGAALALLVCVGWFVYGAAQLGFGRSGHNYGQAADGKQRMMTGGIGAFAVGAAAALVNFFYNAGTSVH